MLKSIQKRYKMYQKRTFFTRRISTTIFSDKTILKHEFKIPNDKINIDWNTVEITIFKNEKTC